MQLEVKNVTMKFKQQTVLQDVSFTLASGGLIGLIGANGAGKSTLMKIIATLQKPTSGEILLDGKNILKQPTMMQAVLGYMPQRVPIMPQLTALEYLQYVAALKGLDKQEAQKQIVSLLARLHLSTKQTQRLAHYSGGMIQRVGLAMALLGDPQIILVDEPTAGLDPIERVVIRNLLSELAQTRIVVLSTHIVSDIEAVAQQLLLIRKGVLTFNGTATKLIGQAVGHVWEYPVSSSQAVWHQNETISELHQTDRGLMARKVGEKPAVAAPVKVTPTHEDACLLALEGGTEHV